MNRFDFYYDSAGWGLRCGDDGFERSRGTLPTRPSPPCRRTPPDPPLTEWAQDLRPSSDHS